MLLVVEALHLPAVRREFLLPVPIISPEPIRTDFCGLRKFAWLTMGTEWDRETLEGVKPFCTLRGSDCTSRQISDRM